MGGPIPAVLLAAGASSRMGAPKQLASWGDKSLVAHAADTLLQTRCHSLWVVLGHGSEHVREALGDRPLTCIDNPDWRLGMGTSLRVGVAAASAAVPELAGVLVALCDQPNVRADQLMQLLDAFEAARPEIAAASYQGIRGVPAVLGRSVLPELQGIDPTRGAKALIEVPGRMVVSVDIPEAAADIDTQSDLARLHDSAHAPSSR